MLEPGDDAPGFTLRNHRDEPVSLASIDAAYTVVYFYPRADTPGCTTEACGFRDDWDAFADADVAVVGISDDPVADLADFAAKFDLPFDLLSDPDGEVASAYGSYGEKNMFGNTFDGVFRNTYVVDADGAVVLAYGDVSPEDHAEAILADVAALADD
ncbi:thioredoxin-dependent thiol peroxidase [Halorubrum sp. JWXQ-INN 858]|uniref:thioredoxin-dependent thiol peroxidase n=1 Tax=Halorubrum sp. JWXQ-INN 858 TaxID=2690782 RepID=UPI001356F662|nr:thioredoxin-dependent thiol peroxidase [Halorubrum sp. JWXQ-INN 858]MWV64666.1 thioredoxin-dependent thiol peroxidase [Halorubrum sp. JWXQ-INN 858]